MLLSYVKMYYKFCIELQKRKQGLRSQAIYGVPSKNYGVSYIITFVIAVEKTTMWFYRDYLSSYHSGLGCPL